MAIPYYPGSLYTPKLGLSLFGQDEVLADNFVILDAAFGSGSSINVNGILVTSPNLSSTLPVAPVGKSLVAFQVDSNGNISAYYTPGGGGSTVDVNSSPVASPNFNNTTPAASAGYTNVAWQVDGSGNISAELLLPATIAAVTSKWLNSYTASTGVFTAAQPAYSDISGTPQLPVTTVRTAHEFFGAYSAVTGAFTFYQPAVSDLSDTPAANQILAGPTSGPAATATFRTLVAGDIPSLSSIYLPLAGGTMTGVLTLEASAAGLKDAAGSAGSNGNVLTINSSGYPIWTAPATSGTVTSVSFTGGLISVATPTTTPALTVAGTSGGIPYFSSTSTWASSAVLPAGDFVLGGGAGSAPTASFSVVPIANGGTATGSTLTGIVRGGNPFTASEISGDATTSGSNALTLATVNSNVGSFTYTSITVNAKGLITAASSGSAPTGTVTSFSAGNLSPLFTTSVANNTTTPALSFSLSNAAGGTVFGNATASAAAPGYTIAPVLGIPGTSTGTIALASSTASGKFTITAPASAATPTFTLPTSSGVGVNVADGTVFTATIAATGTLALATQTKNTFLAGPTTGANAAPTFRAIGAGDIPSGTVTWDQIGSAAGSLTLSNGTNATTFNQTAGGLSLLWTWANTTTATSSTTQSSPSLNLAANYWTGAASAVDNWSIYGIMRTSGTNGVSNLRIDHSGTTGPTYVDFTSNVSGFQFESTPTSVDFAGNTTWTLNFTNNNGGTTNGSITGAPATFTIASSLATPNTKMAVVGHGTNSSTAICVQLGNSAANLTATSGTQTGVQIGGVSTNAITFNPTSGSASFIGLSIIPTIQGTSSGATTALVVNPTITTTNLTGTNLIADFQSGGASEFNIDYSGNVKMQGVSKTYNGIATVRNGTPAEYANSDLTAQSAAITATTLYATTKTTAYRVSWSAAITTAASTSSVLGGTNGFQVLYTSPTDSVVKTTVSGNSTTSAANTTGTATGGSLVVYAKTGTNIQFTYDYTSVGVTAMVYELHITVEAL